ncbi:hypothetical protein [Edaphovirga cremea]|uniref:hypothetical protein n=1 Tax=Edaphovirga cremea TaxID=2267246 RepID=UPI00130030B1|nr:hypothetical protein [Edaphovirga cremea]
MKTVTSLLVVATLLAMVAIYYQGQAADASRLAEQAKADRESAENITSNVITSIDLFNDIARSTQNAKQQNATTSDKVRVVYKTVLAKSACNDDVIDRNIADGLFNRANQIRSIASGAYSGQPDR